MARLPSIDVLRVLAVAIIVYRHTYPAELDQPRLLITTISVPFFFFLTGWLWQTDKRTVAAEARHRWRTLGKPYVSWLVLIFPVFVFVVLRQGGIDTSLLIGPFLGGAYARGPFATFWFVSALLLVAVLMRTLDRVSIPWLLVIGAVLLAGGGIWGSQLALVPLGVGVAIPSVAFAIAGRVLREWMPSHTRRRAWMAAVVLPVAIGATFWFAWLDLKYGQFGTLLVSGILAIAVAWSAIALLDALFLAVDRDVVRRLQPALARVTTVAIVVVLIHPVLIWLLRELRPEDARAPLWVYPVVLIGSWTAALLLERTRLAPLLVGQPRWVRTFTRA